ncbi:MAG: hypothetical protein ABFS08_12670 [Pseudomonadota bacterium]
MHSVSIHINESVNHLNMNELYRELMITPHVRNVEVRKAQPHDMLVEYDEHHNMPMHLLEILQQHGLHADIVGC